MSQPDRFDTMLHMHSASVSFAQFHAMTVASDLEAVWALFTDAIASRGFPRAAYGLTTGASRRDFGRPDQITFLHNMPADWAERLIEDRLFERFPAVRWARRNDGLLRWGRLRLGSAGGPLARLNAEHGVTAGMSISFPPAALGDRALLCLMAEPGAPQGQANLSWERHRCELEALCRLLHLRVLTLPRNTVGPSLNHRQCEVLALIGAGMSVAQTAERIGRTAKAVEKRLAEARRVLSAGSTAEAVLRAADMNLISVFGSTQSSTVPAE